MSEQIVFTEPQLRDAALQAAMWEAREIFLAHADRRASPAENSARLDRLIASQYRSYLRLARATPAGEA